MLGPWYLGRNVGILYIMCSLLTKRWKMQHLINLHVNLICHLKETKHSLSGKTCSIACSDNEAEYKVAGFRVRGKDTTGLETVQSTPLCIQAMDGLRV